MIFPINTNKEVFQLFIYTMCNDVLCFIIYCFHVWKRIWVRLGRIGDSLTYNIIIINPF